MWGERPARAKNAQFDAANVKAARGGLVDDMEVVDGVRAETEVLEDLDIPAGALDRHSVLELAGKEKRELEGKETVIAERMV